MVGDSMKILHKEGKFWAKTAHGEAHLLYRIDGGDMTIYETFVPEEERGKGIAHDLTAEAMKFAENNHLNVIAACSYAKQFMEKRAKKLGSF
ncbi:MAG: GNAT family N-acetyltransferase [Candidatus Micrarchaeaceae archaeon]